MKNIPLFDPVPNEPPQKLLRLQHNTKKILVKGLTGTGKSVLTKLIALDWAKENLEMFPVVFFVDMQLAKPDDTIECIIKEQCDLSQPVELERLESKCLVVIDDFNDFSRHRRVLNFITDQARNVLVTTSTVDPLILSQSLIPFAEPRDFRRMM